MHILCGENLPKIAMQDNEFNPILSTIKTIAENLTGYYICSFITLPLIQTQVYWLAMCRTPTPDPTPAPLTDRSSSIQGIFKAIQLTSAIIASFSLTLSISFQCETFLSPIGLKANALGQEILARYFAFL